VSNTPGNTGIIFSTWKSTGNLQSLLEISGLVSEFVRLSLILVTILVFQSVSVQTRMWPMPNVMAALPNIGGTLCSTPQSLADAHY